MFHRVDGYTEARERVGSVSNVRVGRASCDDWDNSADPASSIVPDQAHVLVSGNLLGPAQAGQFDHARDLRKHEPV